MAGKTRYTRELAEEICNYIREGTPLKWAYTAAGVSSTAFYEWQEKRPDFAAMVAQARAQAITQRVGRLNKTAKEGTWQADAWYLERQDPDEFGRRQVIRHGGDEQSGPVHVLVEYEEPDLPSWGEDDDADGNSEGEAGTG